MEDMVSVIIPTYNRAEFIVRAINSVRQQTYSNIEIIVIDDCSVDDTLDEIRKIQDNRVHVFLNSTNRGACYSRNRGIEKAKGEYLAFLDSDDVWHKDKIRLQLEYMKKNKYSISYTNYRRNEGVVIDKKVDEEKLFEILLNDNFITTDVLMGEKKLFVNEMFDTSLPRYQDWDLILRLSKKNKLGFLNEILAFQYVQNDSITKKTGHEKTFFALKKIYEKNKKIIESDKLLNAKWNWRLGIQSMFFDMPACVCYFKKANMLANVYKYKVGYLFVKVGLASMLKKVYRG